MTKNLTKLSLATILGLGACVGPREEYRPFCNFLKEEPKSDFSPVSGNNAANSSSHTPSSGYNFSSQVRLGNYPNAFAMRNNDVGARHQDYFDAYVRDLPVEVVDNSTSVDFGFARVAASGDEVLVRPIYSPAYRLSLDNDPNIQRFRTESRQELSPFYFENQDYFDSLDYDPERIRREEGIVVSSLLKWIWDWDVFTPLRNTADNVRSYSNEVVKDTLGPNSEFDYTGRRVVLGYNVPIGNFYLECDFWAEVTNPDQNGFAIHMTLPIGARKN